MNHIENLQGEAFPLTGYREMKRIRRVNGEKELTFTLLRTPQNDRYFDDLSYLWDVYFDKEPYKALLFTDAAQGDGYTREVAAIHTFYDDLRSVYQPVKEERTTYTFEEALQHSKVSEAGYQWNFIDTFDSAALEFENFGQDNGLSMFLHALGRWDAEFYVNGTTINIVAERGNDTDFQFRYQVNLDSMEREIDAMDFATVVYGYGKNDEETGQPLVSVEYRNEEMIEAFGVRETSYSDERYTKDEEGLLLRVTEKHQKESLKVSYTFDFFDLRDAGYPRQLPQEGDRILLVDERLNVKLETRIMEIEETFDQDDNIIDCQVTVSNFNTMQTHQERDQQATQAMADALEGKQALPFQALAYAVRRATMQLQNTETQFVIQENGTWLAVDLENENNVVSYNAAGIGISTDAGQSYETAMTAEGIVATTITSGTIRTNNVRIEGANGNMYMDGDSFNAISTADPNNRLRITPEGLQISSDGGNTWTTRVTGQEVMANRVIAGIIEGSVIRSSTFEGLQGNYIDFGDQGPQIDYSESPESGNVMIRLKASDTEYISVVRNDGDVLFFMDTADGAPAFRFHETSDGHYAIDSGQVQLKFLAGTSSRIQARKGDGEYAAFEANDFIVASRRGMKKNMEELTYTDEDSAVKRIAGTTIYRYHYETDDDRELQRTGVMYEESPEEIIDPGGAGVSGQAMAALAWKAIQEQDETIAVLKQRVQALEDAKEAE